MTEFIANVKVGLRCYDVHSGLSNLDPNSSLIAPLANTRVVGMAASLASTIRGQDVVADADSLRSIVADQLDISPYAFPLVIEKLERADMITVQRIGGKIVSFTESVPFHQDLYGRLGETWREDGPSQLEQEMVAVVNRLAASPVPYEDLESDLGLDATDLPKLVEIGEASSLVKRVATFDGDVLYSPFFGFENPSQLIDLFEKHGSGRVADEFAAVRRYQGLPVGDGEYPALADAIARGFVAAPSVRLPDSREMPFAMLPYTVDASLLTVRKAVLEKALAVIACVRTGQHFGGKTSTRSPSAVLSALLDRSRGNQLAPHSSHARQYQLLYRLQIVDFIPSGSWVSPKLIVNDDNVEAVTLARDLLDFGEPMASRGVDGETQRLLSLDGEYRSPIQTVGRSRTKKGLSDKEYGVILDAAMGRSVL